MTSSTSPKTTVWFESHVVSPIYAATSMFSLIRLLPDVQYWYRDNLQSQKSWWPSQPPILINSRQPSCQTSQTKTQITPRNHRKEVTFYGAKTSLPWAHLWSSFAHWLFILVLNRFKYYRLRPVLYLYMLILHIFGSYYSGGKCHLF